MAWYLLKHKDNFTYKFTSPLYTWFESEGHEQRNHATLHTSYGYRRMAAPA